jgi:hypothetical protein
MIPNGIGKIQISFASAVFFLKNRPAKRRTRRWGPMQKGGGAYIGGKGNL